MALNTSLRLTAGRLITKFGAQVTLRRSAPGVYNPATGTISEVTTDVQLRGVIDNISAREANDLIRAGDKRLTIAAKDLGNMAPSLRDRVVISSRSLQIVEVRAIELDSLPITYELILRD